MAKVESVALYIINAIPVDNLKLQKLLYYSQAVHLVLNNKQPLFKDKIEAWLYGPVVPKIYKEYKQFGCDVLKTKKIPTDLKSNDLNTLDMVIEFYGKFTGPELINRTHSELPWIEAYDKGQNSVITEESMYNYFSQNIVFAND